MSWNLRKKKRRKKKEKVCLPHFNVLQAAWVVGPPSSSSSSGLNVSHAQINHSHSLVTCTLGPRTGEGADWSVRAGLGLGARHKNIRIALESSLRLLCAPVTTICNNLSVRLVFLFLFKMTGSTIARVLVALCIGSAVNCMPRGTHRGRRQSQQRHTSSVSQGEFIYLFFLYSKLLVTSLISLCGASRGHLEDSRGLEGWFLHFVSSFFLDVMKRKMSNLTGHIWSDRVHVVSYVLSVI